MPGISVVFPFLSITEIFFYSLFAFWALLFRDFKVNKKKLPNISRDDTYLLIASFLATEASKSKGEFGLAEISFFLP